jgi:hypothetical protein
MTFVKRAPVAATAGAQIVWGPGCYPTPARTAYLERATSTTLRIKAPKAHTAPRAMHASTKVISVPFDRRSNRQATMARGAAASNYASRKNRCNRRYLICKISILRQHTADAPSWNEGPSQSAAGSLRIGTAWGRAARRSTHRSPLPAPAACAGRAWDGRPSGGGRGVFFVQLLLTRPYFPFS